jgi:hypothetical protein
MRELALHYNRIPAPPLPEKKACKVEDFHPTSAPLLELRDLTCLLEVARAALGLQVGNAIGQAGMLGC